MRNDNKTKVYLVNVIQIQIRKQSSYHVFFSNKKLLSCKLLWRCSLLYMWNHEIIIMLVSINLIPLPFSVYSCDHKDALLCSASFRPITLSWVSNLTNSRNHDIYEPLRPCKDDNVRFTLLKWLWAFPMQENILELNTLNPRKMTISPTHTWSDKGFKDTVVYRQFPLEITLTIPFRMHLCMYTLYSDNLY